MKPSVAQHEPVARERVVEAAPARTRIRALAFGLCLLFLVIAARVSQLAVAGSPVREPRVAEISNALSRGDIVDRTGALLATNIPGFTLTAEPALVVDAPDTARALMRLFPDLDYADTLRRLTSTNVQTIYIRRGLTPRQRDEVIELGRAGLRFEPQDLRVYPMGTLAGHVLGQTDPDLNGLAGVELGLQDMIRRAGETGGAVQLSIDARIQFAVEDELARAGRETGAQGAAAIVLDGRTGETLALASWPALDPARRGEASASQITNRAAASRYEMGSTLKPFTVAMALDERLTSMQEPFELTPFAIGDVTIADLHPIPGQATLRQIIAQSSNIGAAQLALRLGPARQRSYLQRLGMLEAAGIQLPESATPRAPMRTDQLSVAVLGYGHGLSMSLTALAGAYTVFTNEGERVRPTLLLHREGDPVTRVRVFSPQTTRTVVGLMRFSVTEGTGRLADVPGLEIAGKTGSAEKFEDGSYAEDRNFSSFAAVFPASNPRYVIVLALDEPTRTSADSGRLTGGAVAAPPVGRIARRIAPALGLMVAPARTAR